MDTAAYKKLKTSRGFTYNYYRVSFFQAQGYGLVVPDMLGYGGTDKPSDPMAYVASGHTSDIIDILDAEKVEKSILIGHDWGSRVVSRLANAHPDRFIGYTFIAVGYVAPPVAPHDPDAIAAVFKKSIGREGFGYWEFFVEEDAASLVEKYPESFFNLFFPNPPSLWIEHLAPTGASRKWVEADRRSALPEFFTEQEKDERIKTLLQGGFTGPFNWYKVVTQSLDYVDCQGIPEDRKSTTKPVLYIGCSQDYACVPALMRVALGTFAKGSLTVEEFDAGHWVILSHAEQVNRALSDWIKGLDA
ncbi:alpha/beta-hydrolase [Multifurca ochricompacta]|uniref:Alpha/beta-hydrolase n=1 Tax=Multifurca ochricompacta TaxID=376703 RepID=A0AAD4QMH1_9AGAM|nr:alpha/beta-hydrolase [Multifurca ochricompacta]